MAQMTVLKVSNIWCPKCRTKLLQAVCGLQDVNKIEVDAAKCTLTVTGEADPYEIIVRARKAAKHVEVVTIGLPPEKDSDKKDENKPPKAQDRSSDKCPTCQRFAVIHLEEWVEPKAMCSIL